MSLPRDPSTATRDHLEMAYRCAREERDALREDVAWLEREVARLREENLNLRWGTRLDRALAGGGA